MRTPTDFHHKGNSESGRRTDMFSSSPPNRSYQHQRNDEQHESNTKLTESVDDFIHFVRNFQGLTKETTELRLKKHAPLPGIGQVQNTLGDGGGGEGLGSLPEEGKGPRRGSYGRSGFNSDSDVDAELNTTSSRRRTPSPPLLWKSDPNPLPSSSLGTTSSYIRDSKMTPQQGRHVGQLTVKTKKVKARRRKTADVHQLPPINRLDIPDRPEAPTPDIPRDLDQERPSSRADRPSSARPWSRTSRRVSREEAYRDKAGLEDDDDDDLDALIDYVE